MVRVLFDITRLLKRRSGAQPTGIDRVTLAYGRWLAGRTDLDLQPVANALGRPLAVRRQTLDRLLHQACAASGRDDNAAVDRIAAALAAGALLPASQPDRVGNLAIHARTALRLARAAVTGPPGGDVYLNVSHAGLDHPALLSGLVRRGVRPVVLVHDLIPISHPQTCLAGAPERHERRMAHVMAARAHVIANSRTTAEAITAYALSRRAPPPDITVARLGIESLFRRPAEPLTGRPYFVAVGTLEPRKNLSLLLDVWDSLAEAGPPDTPRLVLVGRRGWEDRAVLRRIERHPLVLETGELSDPAMARLVAGARALLAPSLVEGFDLPSLEALALGAPVIASDIPAHLELARGAHLLDPRDPGAWRMAILAATTARSPAALFAPPTWRAHFAAVAGLIGLTSWDAAGGE